jgi:4-diphosphocytidyl-2-C-methyl-D-erythritol kinase
VKTIKLRAYGKINLAIDAISKRADGYHDVEMIMQSVSLSDLIAIRETSFGIGLNSNCKCIPLSEDNIAYKAAKLMMDCTGISSGIDIYLQKNIPVAAGMGGGSADAAAVLVGLNKMWGLRLGDCELMDMALSLGADVPFFILGGTVLACGIGEKLTPIKPLNDVLMLIVKPDFGVSTAEVYSMLDISKITKRPDIPQMIDAIRMRDLTAIGRNMCNVLEQVVCALHPEVSELKQQMIRKGALGSLMSGSGPTVYGLFDDYDQAEEVYKAFKERYPRTYLTRTYGSSIEIVEELE